jgi:lon-related putative ATP-dependent protease
MGMNQKERRMANQKIKQLDVEALYHQCDPEQFTFNTTSDLKPLTQVIGQPRAVEAMNFGVGIDRDGFNIFALGPTGTRKKELIQMFFDSASKHQEIPSDWCYVNNFKDPHKPKAIQLEAGMGVGFRDDMQKLSEDLHNALSSAFESDEYRSRLQEIQGEFQERQEQAFENLRKKTEERNMKMVRTPVGFVFAPTRDGEVISPEEFQELPEDERKRMEEHTPELQEELQNILQQVPKWQREIREKVDELNREIASLVVGGLVNELKDKYKELPEVLDFLDSVLEDVVNNVRKIISDEEEPSELQEFMRRSAMGESEQSDFPTLSRYHVNLLVDHSQSEHAPVIYEDNPTYQNLIGRVEHRALMGALITDFNLIKPGSLHQANGGYLIMDARKLLLQPYAWEWLKRALHSGQIRIESPAQMYNLISTVSLEPEPIPLKVKVALLGEPMLYYLLNSVEPEFSELFKVAADFDDRMERNSGNQMLYAQLIGDLVKMNELRSLDRSAVARVIEQSARMAGDSEKLSIRTRDIIDLLREADYWSKQNEHQVITRQDVQKAIDSKIFRSDRLRERVQEGILRKTILIDTEGEKVGQVNGLSVISLGDFSFGQPTRITARIRMGKGQVVDIEREVELGGPIHSKGVLILSGFLGARYASHQPLSLNASLVFEQSYGGVEGDSASSAELYALLSAIANIPIKQSFAVTGSVNQHGIVQAIGGVNEKIEGFFDICVARGLTGEQGVLIPSANVKHLMLRQDVVDAVSQGKFAIYPVETIDQGLELLTGIPAGEPDEEGLYPDATVNGIIQKNLQEMTEERVRFSQDSKEHVE